MTFYSAFKSEFEKQFSQYGFKRLKTKQPYWGKMVGDDIVQIISYRKEDAQLPTKAFCICGGCITLYNSFMDFNSNISWQNWAIGNGIVYKEKETCWSPQTVLALERKEYTSNDEMISEIDKSMEETKKYLLSELLSVTDLKTCRAYFMKFNPNLLNIQSLGNLNDCFQAGNPSEALIEFVIYDIEGDSELKDSCSMMSKEKIKEVYTEEHKLSDRIIEDMINSVRKQKEVFKAVVEDEKRLKKVMAEANNRKIINQKIIKRCFD